MLRTAAAGILAVLFCFGGSAMAFANNPPGTGQPGQTCLEGQATSEPGNGHAANSGGSPFNESKPGTGGANYSPNSQYDVACFQYTQTH